MRSLTRIAVVGISGVVLFKLFATILFPLLGLFFGLFAMTVKLAVIAAVIFFVYSMLRKRDTGEEEEEA